MTRRHSAGVSVTRISRRRRYKLQRQRCGKGFACRDGTGKTIRDKAVKARINQLAIPPAWSDVCIAADERAHIQAIGRDPRSWKRWSAEQRHCAAQHSTA